MWSAATGEANDEEDALDCEAGNGAADAGEMYIRGSVGELLGFSEAKTKADCATGVSGALGVAESLGVVSVLGMAGALCASGAAGADWALGATGALGATDADCR